MKISITKEEMLAHKPATPIVLDVKKMRSDRITLRNFEASEKYEGSDAQQVVDIFKSIQKVGQNFFAAPAPGSTEKEYRRVTTELVEKYVRLQQPHEETKARECYKMAIVPTDNQDTIIGYCTVDGINWYTEGDRDVGYFARLGYQGQGVVTEAARLILKEYYKHAPDIWHYNVLDITYNPNNEASNGVARKVGFIEDPTVRGTKTMGDGSIEPRLYAVLERKKFFENLESIPDRKDPLVNVSARQFKIA